MHNDTSLCIESASQAFPSGAGGWMGRTTVWSGMAAMGSSLCTIIRTRLPGEQEQGVLRQLPSSGGFAGPNPPHSQHSNVRGNRGFPSEAQKALHPHHLTVRRNFPSVSDFSYPRKLSSCPKYKNLVSGAMLLCVVLLELRVVPLDSK